MIIVLWPATAWAANTTSSSTLPMLLPLAALGFFAFCSTQWLRRRQGASEARMEVVARLPIEQRRSMLVVRIGDRGLVVGSSEAGLQNLGELSAEELACFTDAHVSRETLEAS